MTMTTLPTRRSFLTASGLCLASGFPSLLPARARGANDRIRVGFIGVRNRGSNNLKALVGQTDAEIAGLCDVDRDVLGKASQLVYERIERSVPTHHDYRELLDRADIDAVLITTPDHWHALPTIDACLAGKDVYCEKPLSLTVVEGRAMVRAARESNRVVQTGSQQRSSQTFHRAVELIRSGQLGTIQRVVVGLPGVNFDGPAIPDGEPPDALDYDFWLGPAPYRPYNPKQVHYLFRFFWPYSGGQMTNWGAHHLDIVQWALNMDESGPTRIEPMSVAYDPNGRYEVPESSEVVYRYPSGVEVRCRQGLGDPNGVRFEGTAGSLFVSRGSLETEPAEIAQAPEPEETEVIPRSRDHYRNWLEAIRSRSRPICDVEIGHRSATVCHLGNLSLRLGRPLQWDPVQEEILNDKEAESMLSRPYRAPWSLPS